MLDSLPPILPGRPGRRALRCLLLLAVLAPGTGCGGGKEEEAAAAEGRSSLAPGDLAPGSPEIQREIRDLIAAVTPLPANASPAEKSAWFPRRRACLERLRAAGPAVGREALRVYLDRPDAESEARIGLLDVAAHGLPAESRPLLVELVTTFGAPLDLRAAAVRILGETSPAVAVDVLGAILHEERPRTTYPPLDQILEAWLAAARTTGADPVELLALIATDLARDNATRTIALRALGERAAPVGRQALEAVLVESSGNHYLRRIAAQSLQETLSPEEFCPLVRRVLENEADESFQVFLQDMLSRFCQ
ncbi:MAG: hypothetical protein AB1726_15230 [Planctomycetota bacterium]